MHRRSLRSCADSWQFYPEHFSFTKLRIWEANRPKLLFLQVRTFLTQLSHQTDLTFEAWCEQHFSFTYVRSLWSLTSQVCYFLVLSSLWHFQKIERNIKKHVNANDQISYDLGDMMFRFFVRSEVFLSEQNGKYELPKVLKYIFSMHCAITYL